MSGTTTTARTPAPPAPVSRWTGTSARVAVWCGVAFVALLLVLHVARRDVSIAWQTTSEYARGDLGWVMVIAFLVQAVGLGALAVSAASVTRSIPARVGQAALALAALGTAVGGIFVADPIQVPQAELSTSGTIHGLAAGLALVATPVSALLLNGALARRCTTSGSRVVLLVVGVVPLLALAVFMSVQTVLLPADGLYGPGVHIGPAERALVASYAAWHITTAGVVMSDRIRR